MKIKLMYFASLREVLGQSEEVKEVPEDVVTVAQLRDYLMQSEERYASALGNQKRLRAAVNQVMAFDDTPIEEGAEIAFFPPVTGG